MIIDTHAHIIVPEITRSTAPAETWRPNIVWRDGQQFIDFAGKQLKSAVREFVHIEAILEAQDAAGVEHVVLSPWASLMRYDASPAEGWRSSRIYNEALARLAQEY